MKFCQYCGSSIDDSAKFCEFCGKSTAVTSPSEPVTFSDGTPVVIKPIVHPAEPENKASAAAPKSRNGGLAVASFVLGMVGAAGMFADMAGSFTLAAMMIAGIVFGILGLRSNRKSLAIIGLAFSAVILLISAIRSFTFASSYIPYFEEHIDAVRYLFAK